MNLGGNGWTDPGTTGASILVDNSSYKALMIVGNNISGNSNKGREIKVWDYLNVQGPINSVSGGITASNTGGHGIVSNGPGSGSSYYGMFAQSGSYYAALGRADGYAYVGYGELYNQGLIRSTSGGFAFPDGSVQTTAAAGGGISGVTTASGSGSGAAAATCPAGYFRVACSAKGDGSSTSGAAPSGSNACSCGGTGWISCHAYCAK
jgi:hypothetical protein